MSTIVPINKLRSGENTVTISYDGSSIVNRAYVGGALSLVRFAEYPNLKLDIEELSFSKNGGTDEVVVVSNATWSASTSSSWLTITTASTGFTVTASVNDTEADRSGVITVYAWNADVTITSSITVSQSYVTVVYVSYIQTDAKCWFDTGIIPDIDTKIEISLAPLVWSSLDIPEKNWNGFIGAQNSDDSNSTFQIRRNSSYNRWSVRVGNGTSQNSSQNYTTGQTYTLTLDSTYFSINGVNYSVGTSSMDTCNYSLFISAVNNGDTGISWTYHRAAAATFYYVKVWKNNVLAGEFLPAIDNNNIGFYDTVSQTFKANLGTGTPIAGSPL